MEKNKYKYIHFLLTKSLNFNIEILDIFCNNNCFDIDEHLFIIRRKDVYELNKSRCHIIYCENAKYFGISLINKYGDLGRWLFVHSLPFVHFENHIRKDLRNKILWRTWGHDTARPLSIKDIYRNSSNAKKVFRSIVRYIVEIKEREWKRIIKQFFAVGTANIIDDIKIKELFGDIRTYRMPYGQKGRYEILINNKLEKKEEDGYLHVMIGHSGYSDNHQELLMMLKKYENEKIYLHFPLSYGEPNYINKIIKFINQNWNNKVDILTDFLDYEAYSKYIYNMDIIILSGRESYALGNLGISLLYKKTLFVCRNGAIDNGLKAEGIPHHFVDEIEHMNFKEFSSLINYNINQKRSLLPFPYENIIKSWNIVYDDLKKYE